MHRYTHSRRQGYWGESYLLSQLEHQSMSYESNCATSSHGGLFFTISSADPVGSAAPEDGGAVQLLICHTPGKSDSSSIRCRKPPSVNGHFARESLITHRQADVLRDGYFSSQEFDAINVSFKAQVRPSCLTDHSHERGETFAQSCKQTPNTHECYPN